MSLTTLLGAQGSFVDETAARPARLALRSPILTDHQVEQLRAAADFQPVAIETLFAASGGAHGFDQRLQTIAALACDAVRAGSALIILSDRGVSPERAPLPALLVTAAVHHALAGAGLRMRASLIVETGDARDPHQLAALVAFGASAVCPTLGYEIVAELAV